MRHRVLQVKSLLKGRCTGSRCMSPWPKLNPAVRNTQTKDRWGSFSETVSHFSLFKHTIIRVKTTRPGLRSYKPRGGLAEKHVEKALQLQHSRHKAARAAAVGDASEAQRSLGDNGGCTTRVPHAATQHSILYLELLHALPKRVILTFLTFLTFRSTAFLVRFDWSISMGPEKVDP